MPSASVLEQKKKAVEDITATLKEATAGVIVDYRGLTVEQDTVLRTQLRNAGVKYEVVKNTLLRFASKDVGYEELEPSLHGPTALATSVEDPIAPAKVLMDFAKDNEALEIKAGFMEGKLISLDEIKQLANTPSKEVLIAKIMGSLNSPISALARLLNTIAEGDKEIAELISAKAADEAPAEAAAEETPAAEEAPATEEAPAEEATEAPAEEAAPAEETADAE